ncbi:MAG: hypothetical protein IKD41_01300 [Alistipes sp.]|nr:hypothetical protein [Alistipes sp.]
MLHLPRGRYELLRHREHLSYIALQASLLSYLLTLE